MCGRYSLTKFANFPIIVLRVEIVTIFEPDLPIMQIHRLIEINTMSQAAIGSLGLWNEGCKDKEKVFVFTFINQ